MYQFTIPVCISSIPVEKLSGALKSKISPIIIIKENK
jgi:hypothetical protein